MKGILLHRNFIMFVDTVFNFKIYPIKISEEEKWITITFKKKNEKAH